MKHAPTFAPSGHSVCQSDGSVERIVDATRAIFGAVECSDCLRRAIEETEGRLHVLRELLDKVEAAS